MAFLATTQTVFGGVQTAIAVRSVFKNSRPRSRLQKWSHRVEEISNKVFENHNHIPLAAFEDFLDLMNQYGYAL